MKHFLFATHCIDLGCNIVLEKNAGMYGCESSTFGYSCVPNLGLGMTTATMIECASHTLSCWLRYSGLIRESQIDSFHLNDGKHTLGI